MSILNTNGMDAEELNELLNKLSQDLAEQAKLKEEERRQGIDAEKKRYVREQYQRKGLLPLDPNGTSRGWENTSAAFDPSTRVVTALCEVHRATVDTLIQTCNELDARIEAGAAMSRALNQMAHAVAVLVFLRDNVALDPLDKEVITQAITYVEQ